MKILFLSHQASFMYGGEICTLEMLKALRAEGIPLRMALPDGPYKNRASAIVPCLPLASVEFRRNIFLLPRLVVAMARVWRQLRGYQKQEEFSCIHATSLKSFVYAWIFSLAESVPVLWHHHDILPASFANDLWARLLGKAAAQILVPSEATKQGLVRAGVPGQKIRVVRNAFDITQWKKRKARESQARFRLAMIGEISERKGSDWIRPILESLEAKAPGEFCLDIIGEGLSNPAFAEKIRTENADFIKRGLLRFLGKRSDVSELLQEVDALLVPSRQDPLPTVIVEAGLSGVPVLATAVGGIPEMIVAGENGFLCKDPEDFAEALLKLKKDLSLWTHISNSSRIFAEEHYGAARLAKELLAVYRQVQ